jgi:hypothetical protein
VTRTRVANLADFGSFNIRNIADRAFPKSSFSKALLLATELGRDCLYQSSDWLTDDSPLAASDGHNFPGLIDEDVPGIAAVIDDIVEGFEDSVRQPILAHEL